MTKIDSLTIKPLTSGFLVDVQYDGTDVLGEHAYSDLDDLINALTRLLGPADPHAIIQQLLKDTKGVLVEEDGKFRILAGGMDLAIPDSEKTMLGLVGADGLTEALDPDDGWREWDGQLKPGQKIPPGVKPHDIVEYRLRAKNAHGYSGPDIAGGLRWFWSQDSRHNAGADILAYRVVKP